MNIDSNLEANPNWNKLANSGVGGPKPYVPPDDFGMNVIQSDIEREFYISGPAYTDGLFSLHRPIMPNTGKLALQFELRTDEDTTINAQALEFDTRLAIGKFGYNFSSQFNYQKGGVWQAFIKDRGWVDTPFKPGKFSPDQWYPIRFDYSFDTAKKLFSFISVAVGVTPFILPIQFHNLAATPLAWVDSCNLQMQLDLAYKGGSYRTRVRRISYLWS